MFNDIQSVYHISNKLIIFIFDMLFLIQLVFQRIKFKSIQLQNIFSWKTIFKKSLVRQISLIKYYQVLSEFFYCDVLLSRR